MDEIISTLDKIRTFDGYEEYMIMVNTMKEMPEDINGRVNYIHYAFVRYQRYIKHIDFEHLYPWIHSQINIFISNYPLLSKMSDSQKHDFYKLAKTIDHMMIVAFEDETRGVRVDEED
jgi:hypothetical protein